MTARQLIGMLAFALGSAAACFVPAAAAQRMPGQASGSLIRALDLERHAAVEARIVGGAPGTARELAKAR